MQIEFGSTGMCPPLEGPVVAAESERLGFDIQLFGDNPFRTGEPFGEMRAAAAATSHIRVMIGVANFVTRAPSVIASSVATVQRTSGGRAICGVGKGDGAVVMAGRRPQRHADFERDLGQLRTLLQGGSVAAEGEPSRIEWLEHTDVPVPLEVAASGPRSIALAASVADRITLAVGASDEQIRWALDIIDTALVASGRSREDIQIGAAVSIALDDDVANAVETLRHRIAGWVHMASFPGNDLAAQPEVLRSATSKLQTAYDYRFHRSGGIHLSPFGEIISPELAAWYGIAGPPDVVTERLVALSDLGLRHFHLSLRGAERERMAADVMPAVRAALADR